MSTAEKKRSLQESMFPSVIALSNPQRKQDDCTVIAHISDLHFTASTDFNKAPWDTLLVDLVHESRGGIDLLVVTGDLIDSPLTGLIKKVGTFFTGKDEIQAAFEQVSKYLLRLCSELKIKPEEGLFVVPGNHDYRVSGIHKSRTQPERFRECFESFCRPLILPSLNLCVFVLDSNVMEFLDLAAARIDVSDLAQFYKLTSKVPQENARFTRIALLHHHPMPISATEKPGFLNNPGYTMLKNAGQFMTTMVAAGIDLILHGHEHYAAYSKAVYPYGKSHEHQITVISAGSVGKDVCSYNLVKISDNGQVHLERRSLANRALYDYEYDRRLRNYEDARRALFEAHAVTAGAKLRIEKSSRLCVIKDECGDAYSHQRDENVTAYNETVKEVRTYLVSDAGFFFTPQYDSSRISWTWLDGPLSDPKRRDATIAFNPPLTKEERISYYRFSKVFNLFQFNQRDRLAVTDGTSNTELFQTTIGNVFDVLTVTLQFPKSKFPSKFSYKAIDPNNRDDPFERAYFVQRVSEFRETSSVVFSLEKPLPGYRYGISWELPPVEDDELELEAKDKANADELVTSLLSARLATDTNRSNLQAWINDLRQNIISSRLWNELQGNNDLEISLYVYDGSQSGLVCVVASSQGSQFLTSWNDVIKPGETLVGEAFRRRGPAFYNPLSRVVFDLAEYDDRIPNSWKQSTGKKYIAACAIPLTYPLLKGRRVAVVAFASRSNGSRLLRLLPDQNDEKALQEEKRVRQKSLIENVTGPQFSDLITKLGVPVAIAQKR